MKKRIISLLLALIMALSLLPVSVLAADDHTGQVHVTVENTTWAKADNAPWEGTLVDEWVTLKADSTMMSCIKAALDKKNIPSTINSSSYGGEYISAINGIGEFSAGSESGWMGTLNDWFTNLSFSAFTVQGGTLAAGDEIRVLYTKTGFGKDLGSDWSTAGNTALSALSFSSGTLSPAFDKATTAYTLTLTAPASVKVSTTAANKCNQVYLSVGATSYRRSASVPLESGTVLTVRCGDAAEASGSTPAVTPTVYTVTVKVDAPQTPPARREGVPATAAKNVSVNKPYTLDLSTIFADINGDPLTYLVSVNGGAYAKADANYTYTPTAAGATTLTFKANDGHADSTDTYTVTLTAYDKISVVFKGIKTNGLTSFKLYDYEAERTEKNNLLANVSLTNKTYKVSLPIGAYWIEAYDKYEHKVGAMVVTVEPGTTAFNIHAVFGLGKSGWVFGTDYALSVTEKSPDGKVTRQIELGETGGMNMAANKNIMPSIIYLDGDSIKITATPIGDKAWDYEAETWSPIRSTQDWKCSFRFPKSAQPTYSFTVNAPAGSTITGGRFDGSYEYNYNVMKREVIKDDETGVTVKFTIKESDATNGSAFFRVQHPDGVTYWDFSGMKPKALTAHGWEFLTQAGDNITVTAKDLHIGDSSFTKSTITRFEKSPQDRGDIYLNINSKGYKSMTVGETFNLNVFRNWQAVNSWSNAYIAIPDTHYQVVDVNGQPSDVVSIVPEELNSCSATMTANKPGTAIVLVTYDTMSHIRSVDGTGTKDYTAIWPECTGVFVVTVGADGTGIQTNMVLDRMDSTVTDKSALALDAEFDILFYLGDDGATYSFKPEDGCTVSVARSTVTDKMTFSGFTTQGVSVAADGTVTLSGLTTGRHIVKVEKGGVATYQVITARQVTLTLLDKDGNKLPADTAFKPGDRVTLQFWGLLSPQEKMATIYNNNFALYYEGTDGSYFRTFKDGDVFGGMYDFSGNPNNQRVTITIPENWTGKTYDLTGGISLGGFGGKAGHRAVSYKYGRDPVFDAGRTSGVLARLPAVTLRVQTTVLDELYKTTGDFIQGLGTPTVNSIGGEWMTIGLARSGRPVPAGYYDNVVEYVKAKADANERLHPAKVTDNARVILALTSIGKDVTNVGGHNLLKGLDNMAYVQTQGINGPIFTLIALDSHNYPTMGDVTREKLIQVILNAQLPDGGWTLSGAKADPDMTAMAIQALAPYYKTNETVKAAVDKALEALSALQRNDGGFGSWGTINSESCAQVIVALTALGIDPTTDRRFIKNGLTVLDALAGFYVTGGGFRHTAGGDLDGMATEQGYYALASYYRFLNGQTSLYDMSDVTVQTAGNTGGDNSGNGTNNGGTPATGDTGVLVWVIALPVTILAAAFVLKRKEREE